MSEDLDVLNFLYSLSDEQYIIVNNNTDIVDYLELHSVSQESKDVVLDFVSESLNNPELDLDFNTSLNSPANIDISKVQDTTAVARKFRCVYEKLLQSSSFKNLFVNTFGDNNKINVQFEIIENLSLTSSTGVVSYPLGTCQLISNNGNYYNKIKISSNILDNSYSNIEIAKTILHECIHAYLNIKKINCSFTISIPQINQNTFQEIISLFYQDNCFVDTSGLSQGEHAFMFDFMLPAFQTIFAEIRDLLIPPNHIQYVESGSYVNSNGQNFNWNWQDFYKYLSMQGLHNTDTFDLIINSNESELYNFNFYRIRGNQFSKTCN
ncbi:SprT-like domain-containing protein [Flavobacterium sp.]|uniref:SprT-like domain-containing protein n=1 Tax=Flavobacterium sp. TaxID=239 RepID=UPI002B4B6DF8|nr:SprT-like domain-containing protein [Flavobacterium sp.]HLP62975.1 SprT-like domain-containing protein [Flavobacterium sp.]